MSRGADVAELLDALDPGEARRIGAAARERVLAEHTYDRRVDELEAILGVRVAVAEPA